MIQRQFSFLRGRPAIGAADLFELRDLLKQGLGGAGLPALAIGILQTGRADAEELVPPLPLCARPGILPPVASLSIDSASPI
jgi:hypothetical protein